MYRETPAVRRADRFRAAARTLTGAVPAAAAVSRGLAQVALRSRLLAWLAAGPALLAAGVSRVLAQAVSRSSEATQAASAPVSLALSLIGLGTLVLVVVLLGAGRHRERQLRERLEWQAARSPDGPVVPRWDAGNASGDDLGDDLDEPAAGVAGSVEPSKHMAELRLSESEERFRRILQDVDGVAVQGYRLDGSVSYWNRASEVLYGYNADEAKGSNLLDLIIPPEMREDVRESLSRVAAGGSIPNGELELMRKDGSRVPVLSSHTVLRPTGGEPELFCIDIDLSLQKAHEQDLDRIANYDSLTGLPNRRLLCELIEQMVQRAARSGGGFALCYLDLDEFKAINDRYGHQMGDAVLIAVAKRLRRLFRGGDVVARLAGDEFVVVLDGLCQGPDLDRRLTDLLEAVAETIELDHVLLEVQGSIGVTLFPDDSGDPDTLLRHADQAMYRAKEQGRNHYSLFDLGLDAEIVQRRQRIVEIEQALERNEFRLHFQPKIDLRDGSVAGFEGLIRWHDPRNGVMSPQTFLPALEKSDLELRFGRYVLDQALAQLRAWSASGLETHLSINVSGPHLLSDDFTEVLVELLQRYSDSQHVRLQLEILESAAVYDLQRAVAVLEKLRGLGVQIALDDFGTGYSSLSHLRSLPIDEVKIDQTFVRDMLTDRNDLTIVRSVVSLAEAFGLRVVAEGVETEEQLDALRTMGCGLVQGYVFARPMPAEAVTQWLLERENPS